MQYNIFTVQVATIPKLVETDSGLLTTTFFAKLLNGKKGFPYYYMKTIAYGHTCTSILDLYNQGDYVLIEANVMTDKDTGDIILSVYKDHPIL
uniref:Single-stranded DNA binding protein n=1 Tax=Dermonema virens TaxID=1077399 RepID=A0A1G4NRP0_9FLOR|nr:Hypothetical protein ycf41 [Dermonema virens]SCW21331.1 Hypothetical protein ycf41 [Dermonema virens]